MRITCPILYCIPCLKCTRSYPCLEAFKTENVIKGCAKTVSLPCFSSTVCAQALIGNRYLVWCLRKGGLISFSREELIILFCLQLGKGCLLFYNFKDDIDESLEPCFRGVTVIFAG